MLSSKKTKTVRKWKWHVFHLFVMGKPRGGGSFLPCVLVAFPLNCVGSLVDNFVRSEFSLWTETIFPLEFVTFRRGHDPDDFLLRATWGTAWGCV